MRWFPDINLAFEHSPQILHRFEEGISRSLMLNAGFIQSKTSLMGKIDICVYVRLKRCLKINTIIKYAVPNNLWCNTMVCPCITQEISLFFNHEFSYTTVKMGGGGGMVVLVFLGAAS